eukprot:sb/3475151/
MAVVGNYGDYILGYHGDDIPGFHGDDDPGYHGDDIPGYHGDRFPGYHGGDIHVLIAVPLTAADLLVPLTAADRDMCGVSEDIPGLESGVSRSNLELSPNTSSVSPDPAGWPPPLLPWSSKTSSVSWAWS